MRISRCFSVLVTALGLVGCFGDAPRPAPHEVGSVEQGLSDPAARRARAGQIRDACFAEGIEQGWLLAGVASAETLMSHCASEYSGSKCYGPNSSDCGGGPVLAGYWDGPCADQQGGLGMFQFDAGTYSQTLAREGNRILSVAGNVQAAIDFVISRMIYRSGNNGIPVSGITTRAQAIAWMNTVRVGNGAHAKWVEFITKYYNGCVSCSDYANRYARYRDHGTNVYNEMGADFWVVTNDWAASYVSQSFPLASAAFEIPAGAEVAGYIELRNEGAQTWTPGATFLGTTEPRDGSSPIAGSDWVSANRAATVDAATAPGAVGRFSFSVRAPDAPGDYPQYFNLVQESVAWFSSPPDNQLQVRVTSVPNDCGAVGTAWECEGTMRRRCNAGSLEVEACPVGCSGGMCTEDAGPVDADGDGHNTSVDCDDADPEVYPGAADPCGDGLDANCDGNDECGVVVGPDGGVISPGGDGGVDPGGDDVVLSGGCAASGQGSAPFAALLLLAFVATRRRR